MWPIILYTVQHSTQFHYQTVPDFKILSQAVPEKTLTEKMLTDSYTNIVKRQNQYTPLYVSFVRGYNDAAVADVAAVAVVNNAVVAVINVV